MNNLNKLKTIVSENMILVITFCYKITNLVRLMQVNSENFFFSKMCDWEFLNSYNRNYLVEMKLILCI